MRTKPKSLHCERCDAEVHNVSSDAASVLCWMCTLKLISKQVTDENTDGSTNNGELQSTSGDNPE